MLKAVRGSEMIDREELEEEAGSIRSGLGTGRLTPLLGLRLVLIVLYGLFEDDLGLVFYALQ